MSAEVKPTLFAADEASRGDCLSELALDGLAVGELPPGEAARAEAHAMGCARCSAGLEARTRGLADLPELAARRDLLLARIERGARPSAHERFLAWWRAPRRALALAAAGAVAFAGLVLVRPSTEDRLKGGAASLSVHRERAAQVELLAPGATARAGDRLRFAVKVPPGGHLLVAGVEAAGAVFAYAPSDGRSIAADALGPGGLLPGAAELDDSTGEELIQLVWCPRPFALAELAVSDGALGVPVGCVDARQPLVKVAR